MVIDRPFGLPRRFPHLPTCVVDVAVAAAAAVVVAAVAVAAAAVSIDAIVFVAIAAALSRSICRLRWVEGKGIVKSLLGSNALQRYYLHLLEQANGGVPIAPLSPARMKVQMRDPLRLAVRGGAG